MEQLSNNLMRGDEDGPLSCVGIDDTNAIRTILTMNSMNVQASNILC